MTVQTDHTSRPARILARYLFPAGVASVAALALVQIAVWVPPSSLRLTGGDLSLGGYAVVLVLLLAWFGIEHLLSPFFDWVSDRYYFDWFRFAVRRHHLFPSVLAQHAVLGEVRVLEVVNTADLDGPWMVVQPQLEGMKAVLVPASTLSTEGRAS